MQAFILLLNILIFSNLILAQDFTYSSIGDTSDISPQTAFGLCLMGGATEDDNGAKWFLNRSGGGNVVVIRASGGSGYNSYFYNDLGVSLQSVETIVFNNANAASNAFVQRRLQNAEAIWIAGGDQYIYETYWKNTPIMDILNNHVNVKVAPIGGTSAGMAILGEHYFNAEISSVTSETALSNPYNAGVTLASNFLSMPFLENTITDTHYNNPNRKGRQATFIARLTDENGGDAFYGIGANEYVAVCIDENGLATVFGEYPDYPDAAYFIRMNCFNDQPEVLEAGTPLTWNTNDEALYVFKANATSNGSTTFDLSNWTSATGGTWEFWNITNGTLKETIGSQPACTSNLPQLHKDFDVYPNPSNGIIHVHSIDTFIEKIKLIDNAGKIVLQTSEHSFQVNHLQSGIYTIEVISNGAVNHKRISIQN
jgi:cyanophycinase-like exopeptidase